jgi:hypothetical protein
MAASICAPPLVRDKLFGTFTANSAQLNWKVGGAVVEAAPEGDDEVITAEPRPTIMRAKNKSA